MAKYSVLGGYAAEAWSKMVENPGDRTAAVTKAVEALGGKLESFYWSFGMMTSSGLSTCLTISRRRRSPSPLAAAGRCGTCAR